MRRLLTAFALLVFTSTTFAKGFEKSKVEQKFAMEPKSTLVINLMITEATMKPLYDRLEKELVSATPSERLTIIIDSPGGEVQSGLRFVELMIAAQAKGIKFDCVVHHLAASMAFQILTQCDERMTLDGALLLWHPPRVFVREPMTGEMASHIAMELEELSKFMLAPVLKALAKDMDEETVRYHNSAETLHLGIGLAAKAPHFISSTSYIEGLYAVLASPLTVKTVEPKMSLLDFFKSKAQFIYIYKENEAALIDYISPK